MSACWEEPEQTAVILTMLTHFSKVDLSDCSCGQKDIFYIIIYVPTAKILWYNFKCVSTSPEPWCKPSIDTDTQCCCVFFAPVCYQWNQIQTVCDSLKWTHCITVSVGFYFGAFVVDVHQCVDMSAVDFLLCFSLLIKSINETSVPSLHQVWVCWIKDLSLSKLLAGGPELSY